MTHAASDAVVSSPGSKATSQGMASVSGSRRAGTLTVRNDRPLGGRGSTRSMLPTDVVPTPGGGAGRPSGCHSANHERRGSGAGTNTASACEAATVDIAGQDSARPPGVGATVRGAA